MEHTPMVLRGDEEIKKILHPHKDLFVTKGRDLKYGKSQGIKGRPKEEDQDNQQLRCNQYIRKPSIFKDAPLHDKLGRI